MRTLTSSELNAIDGTRPVYVPPSPYPQPRASRNGLVTGSGAEDVGFLRFSEQARNAEQAHINAEREARQRRIDRDKIVQAGLDALQAEATDNTGYLLEGKALGWIAGAADINTERFDEARDAQGYIRELLAEIRAELSPVVGGG